MSQTGVSSRVLRCILMSLPTLFIEQWRFSLMSSRTELFIENSGLVLSRSPTSFSFDKAWPRSLTSLWTLVRNLCDDCRISPWKLSCDCSIVSEDSYLLVAYWLSGHIQNVFEDQCWVPFCGAFQCVLSPKMFVIEWFHIIADLHKESWWALSVVS